MPPDISRSRSLADRGAPIVVRFRPRLRLAPRPLAAHQTASRSKRNAVVIRLDDWRTAREQPGVESSSGAWLILTLATTLLSMFVWRFLR
jgi:hypothetical protein